MKAFIRAVGRRPYISIRIRITSLALGGLLWDHRCELDDELLYVVDEEDKENKKKNDKKKEGEEKETKMMVVVGRKLVAKERGRKSEIKQGLKTIELGHAQDCLGVQLQVPMR